MSAALTALLALAPLAASAQTKHQLGYACKNFVEQAIDDPRSAELDNWTDARATKGKDGVWTVTFPGRARNQFNALRRVTFECRLRFTPPDGFSGRVRIL